MLVPTIAALVPLGLLAGSAVLAGSSASQATVGSGFTVTPADLSYILQQIKIAEQHAVTQTPANLCGTLLGTGPNQINSPLLSFGLRTVDGSCNNLIAGQEKHGAADQTFPRLTTPFFGPAEADPGLFGPPGGPTTSYSQTAGFVFDSEPRTVSNLIVDQTSDNPAAVAVAGFPPRTQGNTGVFPCTNPPTNTLPVGCIPAHETLDIPNVTTDVGLSPPFNSLFTIFGQFFDHGLDKITNGGNGTVFVPLKDDDPLVAGPNHIFGDVDDLAPGLRFMAVTRGHIVNAPDGIRNALNTDSPFVDQSQTYTSHASHQVFLRDYSVSVGRPVSNGKFLSTASGGLATWAMIKQQAFDKLGLQLVDVDVTNIPMIATDPYGNFLPGPNGLPQYVTGSGLIEGNLASPVLAPVDVLRIDTAFLNDIAHSAGPGGIGAPKTPDADLTAGGSLDPVAPGEYDNELLDLHYICGDGRCNENIGLTAIHAIFHMEHDRLATEFDGTTLPANPTVLAAYQATNCPIDCATNNPLLPTTFTYGQRLFQAARFVTEMQYQHLVFEEFARKIQPAINPFEPFAFNQTNVNPAITAEFAHAVYRFGHSMLTDSIPRINADGTHNDISLFSGFLNPAEFNNGGAAGVLSDPDATGAIVMGLSDQVGQELDEFVAETLRNRLLGLPLDLPSINMARARSEGVPRLNEVRRQVFAGTNDGQMAPYTSWVDFGLNLKHPQSLVNFVAAYGTHPTIVGATTLAGKREAARLIVNPDLLAGDVPPVDADTFMFGPAASTGVNSVDLWVGGLAERTNLFGGLLGSTFNYVFEKQLTDLQNGDRFYYLARTPGMNLRTQLEGNSFAELVMRNTNAHTLKADPFATADCKFELGLLTGTGSVVPDVLTTGCDESKLLIRFPDGSIHYRTTNVLDPPGINGQGVYNGTDGDDKVYGGVDNDTFWGGLGNDRIEGNSGDDVALGGLGNDIITDSSGFDVLKGGPGNDAIDGGTNDDIIMSGDGKDFTNGGANVNETFNGPGDDFAIAGQGADAVFGDGGDDWQEGGDLPDLLIGDSSSLFFDDHNLPGHDILIGQGNDDDYDMEGGDDIGLGGPGVEKVAGASGWDWLIGQGDPQAQDTDLSLSLVGIPLPANAVRDKFNEVEALSGWKFNDTLRGDSVIPSQLAGGGFIGCDALDAAGVARINGLDALVTPAMRLGRPSAPIVAASSTNYCLLQGDVWGQGNILLGGEASDTIEGRDANDILDGDRYLAVRLSVRAGVDVNGEATGAELGTTDLLENPAVSGNFGAGTTPTPANPSGMTLQQAVFAGLVNPGQIVAVREILTPTVPVADCAAVAPLNCDTAIYAGPRSDYTITTNVDGSLTITDNGVGARQLDGSDTVWNMERASFCPTPGLVRGTCGVARTLVSLVAPPAAPDISVSTATVAFGNVSTNTASTAQVVTVTNTGTAPLTVSAVTVTGTDAAMFAATNNCTVAIAPAGTCTISVTFTPTALGARTATLNIASNVPSSPTTVALTGTGIPPALTLTPPSLTFAAQNLGSAASAIQTMVLSNTSTGPVTTTSVTFGGPNADQFVVAIPAGCVRTRIAGATFCTLRVQFRPTVASGPGLKTASFTIVSSAGTFTGNVSGTGVAVATIGALPATLNLGRRPLGSVTTTTLTVTNTGSAPLSVSSVVTTGAAYSATVGTCSGPVAPGGTCQLNVTFAPTVAGNPITGTLTINSNASNNPRTVNLTGRAP